MKNKFALPSLVLAVAVMTGLAGASFAAPAVKAAPVTPGKVSVAAKSTVKEAKQTETKKIATTKKHHMLSLKKTTKAGKTEKLEKAAKGEKSEKIASIKTEKMMKPAKK